MLTLALLLACDAETSPTPEPISPTPIAEEAPAAEEPATQPTPQALAAEWLQRERPGIPPAAYTLSCEEEAPACVIHIDEDKTSHYLTCEGDACAETGEQ